MLNIKEWLEDLIEDLSTLEVATLTTSVNPLDLQKEEEDLTADQKKALASAKKSVEDIRKDLLAALQIKEEKGKRGRIRTEKKRLKEAEKQLDETRKALGLFDPKDIFSKIRAALPQGELVAYSRFELEGDSTNFINSSANVEDLVSKHEALVAASQEARKTLFETALKVTKLS